MKIKLDTNEICSILINWAKQKYKTHNVVAELGTVTDASIEVTMSSDQLNDASTEITDMAINKARQRILNGSVDGLALNEPDFSGAFDAMTTPLA